MKLFKYISDDTFFRFTDSFLNGEAYLSKWGDVNDPMEGFFSYFINRTSKNLAADVIGEKSKYLISCFTKSHENYMLWSYYTNKHRGVCLEYDIKSAQLKNGSRIEGIRYVKSIPELDESKTHEEQAIDFLLTKLDHWKQEKEVRLLCKSPSENPMKVGELISITFGVKYSESDPNDQKRQDIIRKIKGKSLSTILYQAKIESSNPHYA